MLKQPGGINANYWK